MKNYICINGNKTELSDEQVRELGFTADTSIGDLSEMVTSGKARSRAKIHDRVTLAGREFEIIGIDHDTDIDNMASPTITLMAKLLLPTRRMHSGKCERGWIDTELRAWLNDEIINSLPAELVSHIRRVVKTTHSHKGDVFETTDKLFIPSESEMFGSAIYSDFEDGARYEAFSTSEHRVRYDEDGYPCSYWTRSPYGGTSANCASVTISGHASVNPATVTGIRAPLCFCFA